MAANPAPSQFHTLASGYTLQFTDHAAASEEQGVVFFIHGSGPGASGWSNFKHNVAYFQSAGYRCIVYDQWGYGQTDKPTDVGHTLGFFVEGLIGLLDGLNISKVHLVGNSLGGAVAMGAALEHPTRVASLILMAPGGIESRETYFAMPGIQAMVKYPMGSPEFTRDVLAKLLTQLVFDANQVNEELISERWATLQTQNAHVLATMQIPDLSPRLAELTAPVLTFWGADDRFCPPMGVWKVLNGAPNVQAELVNRCGHWVMSEYPDLFNRRCIDFLNHLPR